MQVVKRKVMNTSVDLARHFFDVVADRNRSALRELLHPEIEFFPLVLTDTYTGRTAVVDDFYKTVFAWPLYEAFGSTFERLSEDTVHVTGRLRWMRNGQLRDTHAAWTLKFNNGKLRSLTGIAPTNAPSAASRTAAEVESVHGRQSHPRADRDRHTSSARYSGV